MELFIGVLGLFAFIALIAATSAYKGKESWTAFAVFGGLGVLLSIGHWLLHWF